VIVEDDDIDDDDDVPKVVQPVTRNGAMAKDSPSAMTNGKPASRAKGKRKAGPLTNGHKSDPELVVIDELDDDDPTPAPPLQLAKKGKAGSIENGAYSLELEKLRLERDLVRLFNISSISYEVTQRSSCSTKSRAKNYPNTSFSLCRQEIQSQRRSLYT
jgi:hypothetical protein